MRRIARIAAGSYVTHRNDELTVEQWLQAKEISRNNIDVKEIITEQMAKVAGT